MLGFRKGAARGGGRLRLRGGREVARYQGGDLVDKPSVREALGPLGYGFVCEGYHRLRDAEGGERRVFGGSWYQNGNSVRLG